MYSLGLSADHGDRQSGNDSTQDERPTANDKGGAVTVLLFAVEGLFATPTVCPLAAPEASKRLVFFVEEEEEEEEKGGGGGTT